MSTNQIQPAFVLHSRGYREASLLVDFFCVNHGRVSAVAKGIRGNKNKLAQFRPFQAIQIMWSGRTELKRLNHIEITRTFSNFPGLNLYCGYYLNELLLRLLQVGEPHIRLFSLYIECLEFLQNDSSLKEQEKKLRQFEFLLIEELGYGINFKLCARSDLPIVFDKTYCFVSNIGFIEHADDQPVFNRQPPLPTFLGKHLLAIAEGDYGEQQVRRSAKIISRTMIDFLLNGKPLNSRSLYGQMVKKFN